MITFYKTDYQKAVAKINVDTTKFLSTKLLARIGGYSSYSALNNKV